MRFFRILASVICLLAAASAAEIKIKVVDPQSAVVAGAQVVLTLKDGSTPAIATTSAEGLVVFQNVAAGSYHMQVLAPGFAPATTDLSADTETVTIKLRLAAAAETVVVTATRTPVPTEAAGPTSTL